VLVRGENINVLKCKQYHPSRPHLNQLWEAKAVEHDDPSARESQPDNTVIVKDGHEHDKQLLKVKQEEEDGIDYFSKLSREEEKKDGAEISIREITDGRQGSIDVETY
jgi:predicted ribosome quality control (RQC) complex YloA/Tae2 family protein